MRQKVFKVILVGLVFLLAGCGRMSDTQTHLPAEPENKMEDSISPGKSPSKALDAFEEFKSQYPDDKTIYSARVDLDGDSTIENIIITGSGEEIHVWFYMSGWEEVYKLSGSEYQEAMLLDRGKEKHLAILSDYPPNNTQVTVFRKEQDKLAPIFETFADWEFCVIPHGFSIRYKSYQNEGGWVLSNIDYVWDEESSSYIDAIY